MIIIKEKTFSDPDELQASLGGYVDYRVMERGDFNSHLTVLDAGPVSLQSLTQHFICASARVSRVIEQLCHTRHTCASGGKMLPEGK